jgi:WD40 repeat protein
MVFTTYLLSFVALAAVFPVCARMTITAPTRQRLASFSPDGRVLATTNLVAADRASGPVRLWDVDSGKERGTLDVNDWNGFSYPPVTRGNVLFSPDGRLLALCDDSRRLIEIYDVATQQRVDRIPSVTWQYDFRFSPDAQILYYCTTKDGGPIVQARDVAQGRPLFSVSITRRNPVFSPDGRFIVTGNQNAFTQQEILDGVKSGPPEVKIWSAITGELLKVINLGEAIPYVLDMSPRGDMLLVNAQLYDTSTWLVRTRFEYRPHRPAFSSDGTLMATPAFFCAGSMSEVFSKYELVIWDTASGHECGRRLLCAPDSIYRAYEPAFVPQSKIAVAPVFWLSQSEGCGPLFRRLHGLIGSSTPKGTTLIFHDAASNRALPSIMQPGHDIDYLCAPDGSTLALINGSAPDNGRRIHLYDLPPHKPWWTTIMAAFVPTLLIALVAWRFFWRGTSPA